jgi:hypothetical protein
MEQEHPLDAFLIRSRGADLTSKTIEIFFIARGSSFGVLVLGPPLLAALE